MSLDYATLELLRQSHPAWRLLRSEHAPLVASFLQRVFIAPNVRVMTQADLAEALEDELYGLRERLGAAAFPKSALDYLNDWAANDKGWLRKYYTQGSDEPHFDLMPATEKAIAWLETLAERSFVGTESRLLTLFELLKQMSEGSESDPQARIAELQRRRDEIDAEIARVLSGDLPMLDATGLKDRFQQFTTLARELLTDFREVEHNFRGLDRRVRERIALWEGAKGALLEEIMGERDAIADSDQGRSFRAFWDFLMSSRRQEDLTTLLERVLALPPVLTLLSSRALPSVRLKSPAPVRARVRLVKLVAQLRLLLALLRLMLAAAALRLRSLLLSTRLVALRVRLPLVAQPASGMMICPAAAEKLAAPLITGALCTSVRLPLVGKLRSRSPFRLMLVRLSPWLLAR